MAKVGIESQMYLTMCRQPDDVRRLLAEGPDPARAAATLLAPANRILLAGIGTSYHAALMGSWLLRAVGRNAQAVHSFDLAHYAEQYRLAPTDAVVVLSHTGAKQFSRAVLDLATTAGATVLSVGSTEAQHPGSQLTLRTTTPETSAAYTSSHLCAMTVLAQVAIALAEQDGHNLPEWHDALSRLPENIEAILERTDQLLPFAEYAVDRHSFVVGAGPSEVTALEAVIKAREAAYVRMDAMALEQFIHGPMIGLQPGDPLFLINAPGAATQRNTDAARFFSGVGAKVHVIGAPIDQHPTFTLPDTIEILSPLHSVVPMQLLAWHMATLRNQTPDTFRTHESAFGDGLKSLTL